jgi:hypothetical protein
MCNVCIVCKNGKLQQQKKKKERKKLIDITLDTHTCYVAYNVTFLLIFCQGHYTSGNKWSST